MRVVYVCTDEGIPTFGRKGSSVHVQAILTQLVDRGDEVHLITPRPGTVAPPHLAGVTVHQLVKTPAADAAAREAGAQSMDLQVATVLDELHGQAPAATRSAASRSTSTRCAACSTGSGELTSRTPVTPRARAHAIPERPQSAYLS